MNEASSGSPLVTLLWLIIYVYAGYCLMTIAKKLNEPNGWFAFVPVLNTYLLVKMAGKPGWWLILLFIPLVNIVISIIVLWNFTIRLGKSGWWGIGLMVPVLNLVLLYLLAFGKDGGVAAPTPPPALA